ncbi:MAG TPA: hypothetical protein VD902_20115, partial [Symbiobacteriaceae bacterium]|nr:hypothetical protein [Symbiobacteriaceae bacterium]
MRRLALVLLALAILSGCVRGPVKDEPSLPVSAPEQEPAAKETPPVPAPAPAPITASTIATAEIRMGESLGGSGSSLGFRNLEPGDSLVPSDEFVLFMELQPPPDLAWFRAVTISGADYSLREEDFGHGWLQLRFQEGQAGSTIMVSLPPLQGAEQTVYRLTRVDPPRPSLSVEVNGQWQPVRNDVVYPEQNLKLRMSFSAPVDRDTVRLPAGPPGTSSPHPLMKGTVLTWLDDQTVIARWDQAPPVIVWTVIGARGQNGIFLVGPVPAVYTGPAPYLAAVDPMTGSERRLKDVIPGVYAAETSSTGERM